MIISQSNRFFLIVSFLFIGITACENGDDDSDDPQTGNPGDPGPWSMSANIDGTPYYSSGFLNIDTDFSLDEDVDQYHLRIDSEAEVAGIEQRIIVSIFGVDFSSIVAGDVFRGDGVVTPEGGKKFDGDFFRISRIEGVDIDIITTATEVAASHCVVTAIDHDSRLISGTFSFESVDIFGSGDSYQITDGVFTEIPY